MTGRLGLMGSSLILARVLQSKGLRGFVGKLSMDISSRPTYVESSAQESLCSAKSFIDRCRSSVAHIPDHGRLVHPIITPRFVPTCSNELLSGLGRLSAEENVHIQSHLAEARDQVDWVRDERKVEDLDVFKQVGRLVGSSSAD